MRARAAAPQRYDFLVVGAGFAGSVVAERLATSLDARVLLIDRRNHVGGNAYDHHDDDGILVHKYGPHIFHTASREVFEYLSRQLVPMPINLDTINQLTNGRFNTAELDAYFQSLAWPAPACRGTPRCWKRPGAVTGFRWRSPRRTWGAGRPTSSCGGWQKPDNGARAARDRGVDVRAVTAWALLGSFGWDRLVVDDQGAYECGVFDLRAPAPRPTELAHALRALAHGEPYQSSALAQPGWWRRPSRVLFPVAAVRDDGDCAESRAAPHDRPP